MRLVARLGATMNVTSSLSGSLTASVATPSTYSLWSSMTSGFRGVGFRSLTDLSLSTRTTPSVMLLPIELIGKRIYREGVDQIRRG